MDDVAVLGAGRMGAAIGLRLASCGYTVRLWNRTASTAQAVAERDPSGLIGAVASAGEAVARCPVVLCALSDGPALRSVLLDSGVVRALMPGAVVCDLGTSGVETSHAVADQLRQVGIDFLDAPVSGSVPAVETGTLLVMAAGADSALASALPVLEVLARAVVRVGAPGSGQAMKLAVNLVVHDLNAAVSEALLLAESAGIARVQAYDVLQQSVVGAPYVHYKRAAFLDPDTPVAMSLTLVAKDLRLITDFARDHDVAVPVTETTKATVDAAVDAGLGPADMTRLSRFTRSDARLRRNG